MKSSFVSSNLLLVAMAMFCRPSYAQIDPLATAEKAAPIDLTGYWEAVITEDWRWRMLTPPRGDYASVPLNPAGRKIADTFDASKYGSPWSGKIDCRAYGGAGLMRMPTRVHITWSNQDSLKIASDYGEQQRILYFKKPAIPPSGPTVQGSSYAEWQHPQIGNGGFAVLPGPPLPGGKLHVVTENLQPGWLRRNGVPYGSETKMTEWFQVFVDPSGTRWFDVTTRIDDEEYLLMPFITSSDFRKEPDGSHWSPHPCVR